MFRSHTQEVSLSLSRWRRVRARHIVWKSYQGNAAYRRVSSRSQFCAGEHFE